MPYEYTLAATIPAPARAVYDAWLDSLAHSEMTGSPAKASAELGAELSAWDGYITGRLLELVPGERIVQTWRTTKFPEDHPDSIVTLTLEERDGGTLLTLAHSNVPDGHLGYEQGGWQEYYFEPMIAYFSGEPSESGAAEDDGIEEPAPPPQPRAQAAPRRQPPKPRTVPKRPAAKKKAAARTSPKRAAGKKAAAAKSTSKRAVGRKRPAAKKPVARKKAPAPKSRRASTAAKAKKAAARKRAKPALRSKARAKRGGATKRRAKAGRR